MRNSDFTTNSLEPQRYSESSSQLENETVSSFDGDSAEPSYEAEAMIMSDFSPLNEW